MLPRPGVAALTTSKLFANTPDMLLPTMCAELIPASICQASRIDASAV